LGSKCNKNKLQLKVKVGLKMTFFTQHLGLSIFDPNLGWNNPAFCRVYSPKHSWT